MKLTYQLQEGDYHTFLLFTASKSKTTQSKKRSGWILIVAFSFIMGTYFATEKEWMMAGYMGAMVLIAGIFYPNYFRWRTERYYKRFVKAAYAGAIGETEETSFEKTALRIKNKTGEGKVKHSEVIEVIEIGTHFFVKLQMGTSLIIPKREIQDEKRLKAELKRIGCKQIAELDWKWK